MTEASEKVDRTWLYLFLCWLLVTGATLGSFFFSEIMELPPCSLCWYQRIFMFPLPIILLRGLFPFDLNVVRYALPLALCGWALAAYHTLLQIGIVPESAAPCQGGVPCSSSYLKLFGFMSIPILSLLAFSGIVTLLVLARRASK